MKTTLRQIQENIKHLAKTDLESQLKIWKDRQEICALCPYNKKCIGCEGDTPSYFWSPTDILYIAKIIKLWKLGKSKDPNAFFIFWELIEKEFLGEIPYHLQQAMDNSDSATQVLSKMAVLFDVNIQKPIRY